MKLALSEPAGSYFQWSREGAYFWNGMKIDVNLKKLRLEAIQYKTWTAEGLPADKVLDSLSDLQKAQLLSHLQFDNSYRTDRALMARDILLRKKP